MSDIESGAKTWASLSNSLETDAIYCANQIVEQKSKVKKPKDNVKKSKDQAGKACTTYYSHRSSDGCAWEHKNEGQSCVFDHYCSWCKTNRDVKEKHKLIQSIKPQNSNYSLKLLRTMKFYRLCLLRV